MLINSLKFLFYASSVNKSMNINCKNILQEFSENYVDTIGCPSKYKTFIVDNNLFYSQECTSSSTGIVWELDISITYSNNYTYIDKQSEFKNNQISCLNLDCCYLVSQRRSINFKEFFMLTIFTSLLGIIAAMHCMDLAGQQSSRIKAGPSIYTTTKFASQWIISISAILIAVFIALQFEPVIPETQKIIMPSLMTINKSPQFYQKPNIIESVSQCKIIGKGQFNVTFDKNNCDPSIKGNKEKCNEK